jgi:hypothetical protein
MESTSASDSLITPSLRTLLGEIVDYAGVFPPADLSMQRALQKYAEYRHENEAWMLSRFVLPVGRLPALSSHRDLLKRGRPYAFSVVGTGGATASSFVDAFERDLDVIETFDAEQQGQAQVEVMEVPLPQSLVGADRADYAEWLQAMDRRLVRTGTAKLDVFLEVPMTPRSTAALPALCAALATHNSRQGLPARTVTGLKVRCGGGTPGDVPAVEDLAALLAACRDASVPFKATAGLHHPMRHYDDGLDTEMHGFLNLFVAAVLAVECNLGRPELVAILREDTPDNFRFLKESVAWRDLSASLEGVRHVRDTLACSFGSCSFEEPIDHLRDHELL